MGAMLGLRRGHFTRLSSRYASLLRPIHASAARRQRDRSNRRGHEAARLGAPFVATAGAPARVVALRCSPRTGMWVPRRGATRSSLSSRAACLTGGTRAVSDDDARLCGWRPPRSGSRWTGSAAFVLDLALDEPLEFRRRRAHRSRGDRVSTPPPRATRSSRARRARRACRPRAHCVPPGAEEGCRAAVAALIKSLDERAGRLAALQLAGDELDEASPPPPSAPSPGPGAAAEGVEGRGASTSTTRRRRRCRGRQGEGRRLARRWLGGSSGAA